MFFAVARASAVHACVQHGTLAPELTSLHSLEVLDLNGCDVSGTLPQLGRLSRLTHVYAFQSKLSGPIR